MDRYNFEEYITAYIDNELTESKKEEFEKIMESDPECKIKYEEINNEI